VNYQEDAKIVELAGREQSKNGVESVEEGASERCRPDAGLDLTHLLLAARGRQFRSSSGRRLCNEPSPSNVCFDFSSQIPGITLAFSTAIDKLRMVIINRPSEKVLSSTSSSVHLSPYRVKSMWLSVAHVCSACLVSRVLYCIHVLVLGALTRIRLCSEAAAPERSLSPTSDHLT